MPESHRAPYPPEIQAMLADLEKATANAGGNIHTNATGNAAAAGLDGLGLLHTRLGHLIAGALREMLETARLAVEDIPAAGCRGYLLPGGLALGDLALAGDEAGLPVIAVGGEAASALDCARQAVLAWLRAEAGQTAPGLSLTETNNPRTTDLDTLLTLEMLRRINAEDAKVPRVVARALPQLAAAVDQVAERMRQGGRLIYVGAGTSGRLGVLDASEIPPTYGMDPKWVVGIIAGGEGAVRGAVEDAEDDTQAGAQSISNLQVTSLDSVVGIAASGRTPFVIGALNEARRRGALTISMASNAPAPIEEAADIRIALLVGPEVISGSTRMKAGTAQKLALNMLSTGVMVRLGKTYGNWMVDVRATNSKLRARAQRIVAQVCGLDEAAAAAALEAAGGEIKTAIVAALAGVSPEEARKRLERSGGFVRNAL